MFLAWKPGDRRDVPRTQTPKLKPLWLENNLALPFALNPPTPYSLFYSQKTRTLAFSSLASTSTVRSSRWSISSSRFSGLI